VYRLTNVTQHYAWGSTHAISDLLGEQPSGLPEAELWMGAHPSAPSRIGDAADSPTLLDFVSADPVGMLGVEVAARFKNRFPFLLKVLAAQKALSIQTHPTREQAEEGYAADNAKGLAAKDPQRNYVDDWPKPEILYALTDFEALAGCRTPEDAAAVLRTLAVPALERLLHSLENNPEPATVGVAIGAILDWPEDSRAALVADVLDACQRIAAEGGEYADACAAAVRVSADYPGDLGLVTTLLLNHVVLRPGQAMFLAAGGLHAYLRGTGIELMSNSDNVLRAGLTPKHIDVSELLRIMDPAVPVPVFDGRRINAGVQVFDTPVPEFTLYRAALGPETTMRVDLPGSGPRIVLALTGEVELSGTRADPLTLERGQSCFIPAREGAISASGIGDLVIAAPGI
jgi:mannose-6-phosphate isomerase